jgi:predicted lysophospholipase L1 biosynthesis ABC-type transport system permease subunit
MNTYIKDWLIIVAVFGIAIGVLLGYALKTFLG